MLRLSRSCNSRGESSSDNEERTGRGRAAGRLAGDKHSAGPSVHVSPLATRPSPMWQAGRLRQPLGWWCSSDGNEDEVYNTRQRKCANGRPPRDTGPFPDMQGAAPHYATSGKGNIPTMPSLRNSRRRLPLLAKTTAPPQPPTTMPYWPAGVRAEHDGQAGGDCCATAVQGKGRKER